MAGHWYARSMYAWETRLTTRDENRVVRPLEWGFDWIAPFLESHGFGGMLPSPEFINGDRGDNAAVEHDAEKERASGGFGERHPSGAKALVDSTPVMYGLKPVPFGEGSSSATCEAAMARINRLLIENSREFFGYRRPTDFRLEQRCPRLFPTNVRPETLARDAKLRRREADGTLERATFLRFTSPERTLFPGNDVVNARWYPAPAHRDAARPKQAIVVLPQWNADGFSHNALCATFNRMGISALRLSMPYHDIRRPEELERSDYAVSANIGRTLSACRQAVVDIRCCLDWLEGQGYEHFGVLGTSLGSCYAFLASAHDARLRVNAFNHASTAFGDVVWTGQSTRHIRKAVEQAGLTQERLRAVWSAISPVSYWEKFAGQESGGARKRVLLVYADYDLTFPREYSLQVVEAFRRHGINFERRVLPCGHYTTGEFPFNYLDGWHLGSFVYRAFKALREEKAMARRSETAEPGTMEEKSA